MKNLFLAVMILGSFQAFAECTLSTNVDGVAVTSKVAEGKEIQVGSKLITVFSDSRNPRVKIEDNDGITYVQGNKYLNFEMVSLNQALFCK